MYGPQDIRRVSFGLLGSIKEHTCGLDVVLNDHRQASSDLVVECVKEKIRANVKGEIGPNEIVEYMHQEYKVNISYFKA